MDRKAQLEQFLWNAAKAPDSDAARPVIQERASSRDRLREAVSILQQMLSAKGQDHALSAIAILGDPQEGPEQAVMALIGQGYLRIQSYPDSTAFIQGTYASLLRNGARILEIVPDLRAVEIAYVPMDHAAPPSITREEIDRIGWNAVVDLVKNLGKSAARRRR